MDDNTIYLVSIGRINPVDELLYDAENDEYYLKARMLDNTHQVIRITKEQAKEYWNVIKRAQ